MGSWPLKRLADANVCVSRSGESPFALLEVPGEESHLSTGPRFFSIVFTAQHCLPDGTRSVSPGGLHVGNPLI
jgi:hypothetical protein